MNLALLIWSIIANFKNIVKRKLKDQFLQNWTEQVNTSSMGINYRIFKTQFTFENYLSTLPQSLKKAMVKFRTCNNNLPVNRSRYYDIPRYERLCQFCNSGDIGDEYHYLLVCKHMPVLQERQLLVKRYFYTNPNTLKFSQLLNISKITALKKLAKFMKFIIDTLNV